jgi:hypothetical protein
LDRLKPLLNAEELQIAIKEGENWLGRLPELCTSMLAATMARKDKIAARMEARQSILLEKGKSMGRDEINFFRALQKDANDSARILLIGIQAGAKIDYKHKGTGKPKQEA